MNHPSPNEPAIQAVGKTRFIIGAVVFVAGFLSPLMIPMVASSDLPGSWKAVLSTGLVAGLPEVGMLLAVAILGKQGFAQLKEMIFSRFRKITEPSAVGAVRYRLGLFMFFIPLLTGLLEPYVVHFFPGFNQAQVLPAILMDLVFASSFIVLGAGFWGKIRNLFVHNAGLSSETGYFPTNGS